uniref:Ig-like domain-containing protein n=1 Tax=Gallus gallus TaxID=9031 RepID=A0A8V1AHB0_CHICK
MLWGRPDTFWCLLLTSFLQQAMCAGDSTDVFGTEGKSATFHLQNLIGEYLTWSFHGEPILVIRLGARPELVFSDKSFTSRVTFSNNGSSLTILQLTRSDAGTYLAKSDEVKVNFTLHVYRELPEPMVICTGWNCSAESCRYELQCAVDPPGDNYFYWSYNNQPVNEGSEWVVERQHTEDPDLLPYTCTAQNPVSKRNTTVFPSALCAESTASIPADGTFSSSQNTIVVGLVIGLLLLLTVIVITVTLKGAAAESMTVYAEVGANQQIHVWNFPRAQKGDPKKLPASGVEISKTIYATVQDTTHLRTDDEKMSSRMPGYCEQEKNPYSTVSELYPMAQPWGACVPAVSMDLLPATGEPSPSWTQGDELM